MNRGRPSLVVRKIREARCVVCRCTDSRGCPEGCSWAAVHRRQGIGVCDSDGCLRRAAGRLIRILALAPRR